MSLVFVATFSLQAQVSVVSPELSNYLKLTAGQTDSIRTLKAAANLAWRERSLKRMELGQGWTEELASVTPDANRLGRLDVDLEMLNRADREDTSRVAKGFLELLTPDQRNLLNPLRDAQRLDAAVRQAECEGLIVPRTGTSFTGDFVGNIIPATRISTSCLPLGFLPFGGDPGFAPPPPSTGMKSPTIPADPAIRQSLGLSEAQMLQIAGILQEALSKQSALRLAHRQAAAEVERRRADAVPDATVIGLQLAEIARARKETLRVEASMVPDVRAVLTEAQRTAVDHAEQTLSTFSYDAVCTGFWPRKLGNSGLVSGVTDPYWAWESLSGACWRSATAAPTNAAPRGN
jgi:hypothetical protein